MNTTLLQRVADVKTKRCRECQIVKPVVMFSVDRCRPRGFNSRCKDCIKNTKLTRSSNVACQMCGAPFYLAPYRIARSKHVFCCAEHHIEWQSAQRPSFACKWCGGTFQRRSSLAALSHAYCSVDCYRADPATNNHLRQMNANQNGRNVNKLEMAGYSILDDLKVHYERQFMVNGKFCVDTYLPDHQIIIQFDGNYWHAKPELYPNPSPRQQAQIYRDKSQDAYLRKCGFRVLRIWEDDIKKSPASVASHIEHYIAVDGEVDNE